MITCSQCGAENRPQSKVCRMCQHVLDPSNLSGPRDKTSGSLSTTVIFSAPQNEPAVCPVCRTANEAGWDFCQQCGSKLRRAQAHPASPTVPSRPRADQTQVAPVAPPAPKPYAQAQQNSQAYQEQPTYREQQRSSEPPPKTMNCPSCAQAVNPASAFCHRCGAQLAAAHTVAMASIKAAPRGRLIQIIDGDAREQEYKLEDETVIGRTTGGIKFPYDDHMSGRHARIIRRGEKFFLEDEGSRNGTFIKIDREVELKPGDLILIGKQLFRFEL
jgi:hypothetical protein